MRALGLVIALSARAAQYPDEFHRLLYLQEVIYLDNSKTSRPSMAKYQGNWKPEGWVWWSLRLSTLFGLRMAGPGRRAMPYGFVRLPTSVRAEFFLPKQSPERLRMSRFVPDFKVIRGW